LIFKDTNTEDNMKTRKSLHEKSTTPNETSAVSEVEKKKVSNKQKVSQQD
ncbi:17416_t:CDS:2, partial [Racocetra persica]